MAALKCAFGILMLFLLASTSFAAGTGILSTSEKNESQVYIIPAGDATPMLLNISVVAFEPAQSSTGATPEAMYRQWRSQCAQECEQHTGDCPDGPVQVQFCIDQKSIRYNAASTTYKVKRAFLQNAKVMVYYFAGGQWLLVPGCENLVTDIRRTTYIMDPATGNMLPTDYYYAQCDVERIASTRARTSLRVVFPETPTVAKSYENYEISNANVTTVTALTRQIDDFLIQVAQGGGAGIAGGGQLPCVGVFLIMGLLLASLYFAGKSPISLLDITTPRLPAPKGMTASGQILTPFGYTEMKRVTMTKMSAAQKAIAASARFFTKDDVVRQLEKKVMSTKDRQARMIGDLEQNRNMAVSIITAGRSLGMSAKELEALAKLPYHYGDAEQRTVARILEGLQNKGGRSALMAMTIKDYLLGQRTYQSLEVLTAQPDIGKRSMFHSALTSTAGKFYGANRYAVLGGAVMPAIDSTVRSGRIIGRFGKATVTQAAPFARGVARTTMELIGGRHAMEELEARARVSPTAAWVHGQLTKHPSEVRVGSMFPINDKMAHLYRTLYNETQCDQMRYVLRQLYTRHGIIFNVSEEEMASMGHTDVDILKRCGYTHSAELAAAEREIRAILSNAVLGSTEKLNALTHLAEKHGAAIDHRMMEFSDRVASIEHATQPEHLKLIMLQQALEEQNKVRMSVAKGGRASDNAYYCHVGGDSIRGGQVWETMVLRTMVWDGMNGFLHGGIREELVSARLNVANRLATLHPDAVIGMLPEYMRNDSQLKAVAERNRKDLISLFSQEGKQLFQQTNNGKAIESASIADIVNFMKGGQVERSGHRDPKTGRVVWWASDMEHGLPQNATLVDLKRHWLAAEGLAQGKEMGIAIGGWVEGRFTKSYIPAMKQSIEAELNRMAGSAGWSVEERTQQAKKLWMVDQLKQDMEQRFNSQFGQNTYGTTHETMRFYGGIAAGFMEKALQEKGMENNHPDLKFLQQMDVSNPRDLARLNDLMKRYSREYNAVLSRDMTYDDITKSNKAVVSLHEGGFAYYKKGMMLSDYDRVMAGDTAIRDNKGQLRKFVPEDVPIKFVGRDDLLHQYQKVRSSQDPAEWQAFVQSTTKWSNEGPYDYEKKKVCAHVLWQFATTTHDYERFWKDSGVTVEAKRQVTPVAPTVLRYFGYEGTRGGDIIKPFRDIGLHAGDYVSKVALAAGGPVHKTSYDIIPTSSILRQHSDQLAFKIMSGEAMKGLSKEEQVAYRNVAMSHGAYLQVWQFAIDRNPWGMSTSFGTQQAYEALFHMGPSLPFSVKDNLRAYLSKGEYTNFMSLYGFPMDFAGKIMRPYINMMRGMQMSMQGYATSWDQVPDALRQWNYTSPRLMEAMQSLNPFSAKWTSGKTSERIAKLNVFGGSLEQHQLAGPEFLSGLWQGPSHTFLKKKGTYAYARTGDVNPGESYYDYRLNMRPEPKMMEYLFREKEAAYLYDNKFREAAMDTTTRRTVSAETLSIRREQELRGFGILQNPLFGWASPAAFLWHAPIPFFPQSATPKDLIANYVRRSKYGSGGSFGDSVRRVAEGIYSGTSRIMQPHKTYLQVWCPKCGASGYRGSVCRSCKQALY